jgi:LysR family transcriptional regulator, cyn operon transcriptional activator
MIESQIELRHLRYFVALADHRHFTRAAEAVNISQPTLSQQIRQLEAAFGSLLVDRAGKRVTLTVAGEALLPRARTVLQQLREAQEAVTQTMGLRSGNLRVAVVHTVNATLLPRLLGNFAAEYPGINVSSRELSADELEAGVLAGSYDLGIGFSPAGRHGLDTEPLFEEELVAIVPAQHAMAGLHQVRLRDLAAHGLALLPRGYCTRELIQAAFARYKVTPRVALELNSLDGLLSTVQQTGLLTILPALAMDEKLSPRLRSVPLAPPRPRRTVAVVWRSGAFRTAAARAFAEKAATLAAEMIEQRSSSTRGHAALSRAGKMSERL